MTACLGLILSEALKEMSSGGRRYLPEVDSEQAYNEPRQIPVRVSRVRIPQGRAYDEVSVGDEFDYVLTITEAHLVTAAGLFGDFNPLHVDETFARQSRFGGRILHGPFTSAFVAAPVGIYFSGTAIAYLEHDCRFLAPVKPGDTLRACWKVADKSDKPKFEGGVIALSCSCTNQQDTEVASASGKIMVAARASTRYGSDE